MITLERLWLCTRRLITRSEEGLTGTATVRLLVLEGRSLEERDAHMIGQEDFDWGRKLLCNQKSDLIWSQVELPRTPEPVIWWGDSRDLHESGSIEHWNTCRIVLGDHLEDDLQVSDEHRSGEWNVLFHSGGQNGFCDLRLGRRESRFPQNLAELERRLNWLWEQT